MTVSLLYALVAVGVFGLGLHAIALRRSFLARLLAVNVMGTGVFMLFVALGSRGPERDPVPIAMVLTGIVVAVAATGFAVALIRRSRPEADPEAEAEADPEADADPDRGADP